MVLSAYLEVVGFFDSLDEVVGTSLVLDDVAGLVGEHADDLMGFLPGTALVDDLHDKIF